MEYYTYSILSFIFFVFLSGFILGFFLKKDNLRSRIIIFLSSIVLIILFTVSSQKILFKIYNELTSEIEKSKSSLEDYKTSSQNFKEFSIEYKTLYEKYKRMYDNCLIK
ncbi:MAG: hypothetical protein FWH53_00490 [Leptospirales bacterium]|nr:hypothetical protein [Leptospirales bacterium]